MSATPEKERSDQKKQRAEQAEEKSLPWKTVKKLMNFVQKRSEQKRKTIKLNDIQIFR